MLLQGKFKHNDIEYQVVLVEGTTSKRLDIFIGDVVLTNPSKDIVAVSVVEDLKNGYKEYYGNLDLYYAYERIIRATRLHRFNEDEIDEYDDFEDGKVLFICNQKSERYEYNFKSENNVKVYRYMRCPEGEIELELTNEAHSLAAKHLTLSYTNVEVKKSDVNEDSLILSRIATVSELREKFDLSWLQGREYIWVDSIQKLKYYVRELMTYALKNPEDAILAVDTETTGLNIYHYPHGSEEKDKLVSIIMTWKKRFALYIPVGHKYEKNLPIDKVINILAPILKYMKILTQYGTFDWKVFRGFKDKYGKPISLNIKHDFLLANYILQPNPRAGSRSLKDKAWELLKIKQLSLTDLFPSTKDQGKMEIRFELLPKETALIYACPDVDLLLEMYEMVRPTIPDISRYIYETEIGFMPISASAEYYGLRINMEEFEFEKKLCEQLVYELQEIVYKLAGYRFNLNSPDQVSDFIYNKLGCEILIASKSNPNKGSTSSKALKYLSKIMLEEPSGIFTKDIVQMVYREGQQEPEKRTILEAKKLNKLKYPAIAVLMEYRNYSKLLTSFFNSIEESNKGGRLFSWVNQTGAQTGRIISPLQTLPPFIKKMIVPDTSEHGFIIMDYKQVELRLMFGLAKETKMIELSENPDNDIHRLVAAQLYHMKLWEINSDLRKKSKGLNFGIPYWLGDASLAETLYGFAKNKEHKEELIKKAREDKRRFFDAMPRVERLFLDARQFIRENGCMFTLLGRGFYYDSIFTETNKGKIARILRQGGNGMIQGLGADLFKTGTVNFEKRIKKRGWDEIVSVTNAKTGKFEGEYPKVRQAFFVHDELGVVYHKKSIHPCQVLYELRNTMQMKLPGFPTLFIGASVVSNWGDAKEDKYEIPTQLLEKWCKEVEQGMYTEPIDNPEEWVYNEIVKFKTKSYREYIFELRDKLIKEGKEPTPDAIAKIFRHDTLTHDMIAMYNEDAYEKANGSKPEHIELVEWAVQQYIKDTGILDESDKFEEFLNPDEVVAVEGVSSLDDIFGNVSENPMEVETSLTEQSKKVNNVIPFPVPQTRLGEEEKTEVIELADELDEFSNPIDVNVDYEFDDSYNDEYSESYYDLTAGVFSEEEYKKRKEEIKSGFSDRVITVQRKKIIDINNVTTQAVQSLTEYLKEQHRDDGLYEVAFNYNGKLIETQIKVDSLDDTLIDMLLNKSQEEIEQQWKNVL